MSVYSIPASTTNATAPLANPFYDHSTGFMPRTMGDLLDWSEYLWATHGTYRAALQRVIRYFITDIVIKESSGDIEEAQKYKDLLSKDFSILTQLANIGDDMISCGNSFSSIYTPIDRMLRCTRCHSTTMIAKQPFTFVDFTFKGKCIAAKCAKYSDNAVFDRVDSVSTDIARYKVIRWSPREIKLSHNVISGDYEYFWKIPDDVKTLVKNGDPFTLSTINWEIVEAIQQDADFKFLPGKLKHLKETTVTSVRSNGWGIPKCLHALKQTWYLQLLKRQNEAIALDYMLPFRVISPGQGAGSANDPLRQLNMGGFVSQVSAMLSQHRKDPASVHTSPVPIQYQSLGTEGATMVTPQLIKAATEDLLNELGVPAELYYGNLRVEGAPLALRLFERMHADTGAGLNDWLNWLVTELAEVLSWGDVSCGLRSPTIAEDLELKSMLMQLQAASIVSKDTALSVWNIDAKSEFKKVLQEQRDEAKVQLDFEREDAPSQEVQSIMDMNIQNKRQQDLIEAGVVPDPVQEQQASGGGMGAPMSASPTGGEDDASIYDMDTRAMEIAQQLLGMPESQRRSEMIALKKNDETLHAIVKSKLETIRNEASLIGRDQVIAQQMPQ